MDMSLSAATTGKEELILSVNYRLHTIIQDFRLGVAVIFLFTRGLYYYFPRHWMNKKDTENSHRDPQTSYRRL